MERERGIDIVVRVFFLFFFSQKLHITTNKLQGSDTRTPFIGHVSIPCGSGEGFFLLVILAALPPSHVKRPIISRQNCTTYKILLSFATKYVHKNGPPRFFKFVSRRRRRFHVAKMGIQPRADGRLL